MRSRYWLHTYFKLLLFLVIIISFFTLIWYLIYLSCILILYLLYSQYLCRDAYNFTTFICSFVLHFFLHLSFFLFSGGIFGHQFCSAWWKCIICFPLDTSFTEIIGLFDDRQGLPITSLYFMNQTIWNKTKTMCRTIEYL